MESDKIITFEVLNKVNYQDFKKKFEEMGISEHYVAGKKKVNLINIALEKLAEIKEKEDIKRDGIPEKSVEEVAKEIETEEVTGEVKEAKEKQAKKEEAAAKAKAKAEKENREALENIPKIEDYVAKINRVDMNLLNNIKGHRQLLLNKKAEYCKQFKKHFRIDWETYERNLLDE